MHKSGLTITFFFFLHYLVRNSVLTNNNKFNICIFDISVFFFLEDNKSGCDLYITKHSYLVIILPFKWHKCGEMLIDNVIRKESDIRNSKMPHTHPNLKMEYSKIE